MSVCVCCSPTAAQARLANKNVTSAPFVSEGELVVICNNPRCRSTQRYSCAMKFCSRAFKDIPKHVQQSDPWLREMMPYYHQDILPAGNIHITNCIRCCLSATIPDGIKPSPLLKVPHPDPIPGCNNLTNTSTEPRNPVGEHLSPTDTNLNEHVISNLPSGLAKCNGNTHNADEDTVITSSTTSSLQSMPTLNENDCDSLSSDEGEYDDDEDDEYVPHEDQYPTLQPDPLPALVPSKRKRTLNVATKSMATLPTQAPDSMDYLSQYATNSLKCPNYSNITRRYVNSYNSFPVLPNFFSNPESIKWC